MDNHSGTRTISVTFVVGGGVPPSLQVSKDYLSFAYPHNAAMRSQNLIISNAGGGVLSFTAAAKATTGKWLSVSPLTGQALPAPADPMGLPAGTYAGQIVFSAGTARQTVQVTMTISSLDQAILPNGTIMTVAGNGQTGYLGDGGPATSSTSRPALPWMRPAICISRILGTTLSAW